jgi:hypothetical protein
VVVGVVGGDGDGDGDGMLCEHKNISIDNF